MSSAAKSGRKPSLMSKIPALGKALLAAALVLIIACLFLKIGDNSRDESTRLNTQLATLTSALEQLDTLETRFAKRVTQLEEAKANLEASPEDEKLKSKLDRAQGEYDKALRNRDQQKAKVDQMPTLDDLTNQILELKEHRAGSLLLSNLMIVLALIAVLAACAISVRKFDLPVILPTVAMLTGALIIVFGVHLNNLAPVRAVGVVLPGAAWITAGLIIGAIAYPCYWIFLTKAKIDVKFFVGLILTLAGAGLFITGYIINNLPNALNEYINYMSPGFLYIFSGIILFVIGSIVLAFPLTKIRYDIRKNPILVLMVLPSVCYFLITSYLPMVGVYFGFTSYQFTTNFFSTLFGSKFVGLDNFEFLFASGLAWRMTLNTLIYNFIFIVGGTILKVAIAIMFSEIAGKFYKKWVQTITFLPHFISMVMVGTFAYNLLSYNTGVINSLLVAVGLERVDFYSMPIAWYVILPLVDFWKGVGYGSIIYVSAITGISDELYEAADLDGANFWQEILHITIPSIRPTIVILTLMSLGSIMKGNFDLFYQLVGESGQLMETTEIIDTYVWRALRTNVQIGMGSAAGLYQSFVGMLLVVTVNAIVKKIEPDYALF